VGVTVVGGFVLAGAGRLEGPELDLLEGLAEVAAEVLAVAEHGGRQLLAAVQALLLDCQLAVDAVQAVKFGAVGTDVSLRYQSLAHQAGEDVHQAPVFFRDGCGYHKPLSLVIILRC
jgi:hypothetical protein